MLFVLLIILFLFSFNTSITENKKAILIQKPEQSVPPIQILKDSAIFHYKEGNFKKAYFLYTEICKAYQAGSIDSLAKYYDKSLGAQEKYDALDEESIKSFIAKYGSKVKDRDIVGDLYVFCLLNSMQYSQHTINVNRQLVSNFIETEPVRNKLKYEASIIQARYFSSQENCEESMSYLQKAETYFNKAQNLDVKEKGVFYYNAGACYLECNQLYLAREKLNNSLALMKKYLPANHMILGQINNALGVLNEDLGNSDEAISFFNDAYTIFKSNDYKAGMAMATFNQSTSELNMGMAEQSEVSMELYFKLISGDATRPDSRLVSYWATRSLYYAYHNRFIESDSVLELAVTDATKIYGYFSIDLANIYSQWGVNKRYEKKYQDGIRYCDKSIEIFRKLNSYNSSYWKAVISKAKCLIEMDKLEEAQELINSFMKAENEQYQQSSNEKQSISYLLGEILYKKGNLTEVLKLIEPIVKQKVFSTQEQKSIISEEEIRIVSLYIKALFKTKLDAIDYSKIIELVSKTNDRLDNQLFLIQNSQDFRSNKEAIYELNSLGISAVNKLYSIKKDVQLFNKLFSFSTQANSGQIADNELIKRKILNKYKDTTAYEELINIRLEAKYIASFSNKSEVKDANDLKRYNDLDSKITSWKEKYPDYLNYLKNNKYNQSEYLLKTLRKQNAALVSFLKVDKNYFACLVAGGKLFWYEIGPVEVIDTYIDSYNNALISQSETDLINRDYFSKITNDINVLKIKKLVIIPSGKIWDFNFETLHMPDKSLLVEKIEIQYATTIPQIIAGTTAHRKPMLVIAPGFQDHSSTQIASSLDHDSGNFSSTPWSVATGEQLVREYNATSLVHDKATKSNVLKYIPKYSTIHFSTHASCDKDDPTQSALILSGKDNQLGTNEIYTNDLHTELVTLIGCETGLGRSQVTEGNSSLANAFLFAGARCVIQSLWKIDDQESNLLIQDFYKRYFDGKSISSLRNAKLKYLSESKGTLSAPYYWAGLIVVGNELEDPVHDQWFWVVTAIVTFSLICISWYNKRKMFT